MNLRKHQKEFQDIINEIIAGSSIIKTVVCECTPGSGKSLLPAIAGKLIAAGLADALCWIVPRRTLQYQGEANFQSGFFRKMIDHNLNIRSSTNEVNPCRGLDGIITTYQAVSVDNKHTVLSDFSSKRYILILDENQHVEENGTWHNTLRPIISKAKYIILLTGTPERGNGAPIAIMSGIDLDTAAVVKYSRKDALQEKAIIPLRFFFSDGSAEWLNSDGKEIKYSSIATMSKKDVAKAVYTAISTDYAEHLTIKGLTHWIEHKKRRPSSKLLVITANVALAKKATAFLNDKYRISAEIATSHESTAAQKAMKRFKAGITDVLVGVAMFYEGFSCKQVSHIISLTHIRSKPWLEQMFARAVRVDPDAGPYETQCAYIFAPDDPILRKVVSMIEAEQASFIKKQIAQNQGSLFNDSDGNSGPRDKNGMYGITPVGSAITGHREMFLGNNNFLPIDPPPLTPSEIENDLLGEIESHVRQFSFINRYNPKKINAEIKRALGKPRGQMTVTELYATIEHIKKAYPLNGSAGRINGASRARGGGKRVPIKAKEIACEKTI